MCQLFDAKRVYTAVVSFDLTDDIMGHHCVVFLAPSILSAGFLCGNARGRKPVIHRMIFFDSVMEYF
jgi:hypothetical protein